MTAGWSWGSTTSSRIRLAAEDDAFWLLLLLLESAQSKDLTCICPYKTLHIAATLQLRSLLCTIRKSDVHLPKQGPACTSKIGNHVSSVSVCPGTGFDVHLPIQDPACDSKLRTHDRHTSAHANPAHCSKIGVVMHVHLPIKHTAHWSKIGDDLSLLWKSPIELLDVRLPTQESACRSKPKP